MSIDRSSINLTALSLLGFEKRTLKKLMRQVGGEIRTLARSYLRKGGTSSPGGAPASRTGALRKYMTVGVWRSGLGVGVRAGALGTIRGGQRAFPYSNAMEAGAKGPGRRQQAPRPFLGRALAARQGSLTARVKAAVENDIKFVAQKGLRK